MIVDWLELINVVMIFQLLFFSAFLFIRKTNRTSNLIFGVHLFSQAAGIFHTLTYLQKDFFYFRNPHLAFVGYPLVFLWGPSFFLYVKSIAYKNYRLRWKDWPHALPAMIVLFFFLITFYFYSAETKRVILGDTSYFFNSGKYYFDLSLRIQILIYILLSFRLLRDITSGIKENFSSVSVSNYVWLRFIVIGYTICFIISVTFIYTEFYLVSFSRLFYLGNFLQFFIYFNIIFFKAWAQPEIFHGVNEATKYKSSRLREDDAKCWTEKLKEFITVQKPYLDPELTLKQLSDSININQKFLSQIINEHFRLSFYDYINGLRTEEAKRMLLDPACKKNVLEILYESGFNSKATFNRVFKKHTGLSPTEFKKINHLSAS